MTFHLAFIKKKEKGNFIDQRGVPRRGRVALDEPA